MKDCPKWLPDELHAFARLHLKNQGPDAELVWRLCTDERMREVWEWYWSETVARMPKKQPQTAIPVSTCWKENWFNDPEHFLTLMLLPKRQLDKFSSMAPGERRKQLKEVHEHATALMRLLQDSEICKTSDFQPDITIPKDLTAAQVAQDLRERKAAARQLDIPIMLPYTISPDGAMKRLDDAFPYSSLADILNTIADFANRFEELAEGSLLENISEIKQGGNKARKKSYLLSLHHLIRLVGVKLPAVHYASIVNAALSVDEDEEIDERTVRSHFKKAGKDEDTH